MYFTVLFYAVKSGFPFSGMIAFDINIPDEQGVLGAKLFLDSLKLISNQVRYCSLAYCWIGCPYIRFLIIGFLG